jgi:teichuronic acid biosynthesis glycosyltransferase TuaC
MRIAVVTTSYPASEGDPAGHFVRAEVRGLERDGHEVHVVAPASGGAFGWPGVATRVRARPWTAMGAAGWAMHARTALAALSATRVICHWVVPSVFPIAWTARAPIEGVSHGGDVRLLTGLPSPLRAAFVRRIAARVVRWRFVSDALLEDLCRALPATAAFAVRRVAVVAASPIDVPPDPSRTREARAAALRGEAKGPLFVAVGRLVAGKRVERAIDHVAAQGGDARLVVVGDGPERARLRAHARARRLDVRFVGDVPRDEALAWIAASDALVHASEAEGLSTVIREAELLGVRVDRVGAAQASSSPAARATLNEMRRRGHP